MKLLLATFLCIGALNAGAYTSGSDQYGNYYYSLGIGEKVTGLSVRYNDTILCGNPSPYPQPQPPPPPPPQQCDVGSVTSKVRSLLNDANLVENRKCPKSYYVSYCGNDLEEHSLANVVSGFGNSLSNLRTQAENICRSSCGFFEKQEVTRDYNRLVERAANTNATTINGQTMRLITNSGFYQLRCW